MSDGCEFDRWIETRQEDDHALRLRVSKELVAKLELLGYEDDLRQLRECLDHFDHRFRKDKQMLIAAAKYTASLRNDIERRDMSIGRLLASNSILLVLIITKVLL